MAKKLTDEEIIELMIEYRQDCELGNADMFERMAKAERFRDGDQWDPVSRHYREKKGKFCLTINLCKPQVSQVVGSQVQNPKDVVIVPERSGSSSGAKIRSRMVKHAMDAEHAVFEMTKWFESGVTSGLGLCGVFIDRDRDPKHGDLTIEQLNEFECGFDPNCASYDINSYANGAKYFIWEPWIDKDLIHEKYRGKIPDIEDKLGSAGVVNFRDPAGFWGWLKNTASNISTTISRAVVGYHPRHGDTIEKYKYKVTHTWWRKPKTCVMFYDHRKPETQATLLVKDEDIRIAKKLVKKLQDQKERLALQQKLQPGEWPNGVQEDTFEIEEVVVNVMMHTVRVGNELLENIEDEFNGVMRYPIVPYSAYFSNGYRAGLVEDMIGSQEEINWSHSQDLEIVRNLSTYYWMIGEDKSQGPMTKWLEQNGDEDGVIIDKSKFGGEVEKTVPRSTYNNSLAQRSQVAINNLKIISNVRTEDPSSDQKSMSGRAIALKQLGSQTGQASLFQNFDYSLNLLGRLIDEIIVANDVYSADEIRAIVEDDDLLDAEMMEQAREMVSQLLATRGLEPPEPPQQTAQPMAPRSQLYIQQFMEEYAKYRQYVDRLARPIAEDMLLEEIRNLRLGRYTTKVTLSNYSMTARLAEQAEYRELNQELIASGYPPLSRKMLIEASDIKNKEQVLQEDKAMQQQMVQAVAQAQTQRQGQPRQAPHQIRNPGAIA